MRRNWREHYNVFVANLALVLGFMLNIVVARYTLTGATPQARFLFLTPFLGIVAASIFYFFDVKWFLADYPYKKFHFQKKWTWTYLSGVFVFFANILVNVILLALLVNQMTNQILSEKYTGLLDNAYPLLWSAVGVSIFLSLISIGLSKTAHFKIDVEMLKAKKGEPTAADKTDSRPVVVDLDQTKSKKDGDNPPEASGDMTSL
ncbi:DUF5453 family protein [Mycoplasmoides pneumoniae]|uniref:DUF5453 family protein n=1 Tax=Mycoplasmoides pneumoniae TaxID=2104 RepID=UPI0006BA52B0|nr:DUF5453 family protein [Mycoplasmoides pneumoniae]